MMPKNMKHNHNFVEPVKQYRRLADGTEQRLFVQKLKANTAIFRYFGSFEELAGREIAQKQRERIVGEVVYYSTDENGKAYCVGKAPLRQWEHGGVVSDTITLPKPLSKDTMLRTMTTIYPAPHTEGGK